MVLLLKIIILTIILYLFSYLYTKYKHPFWFKQPVSHYFSLQTNNGIITDKVMLPHKKGIWVNNPNYFYTPNTSIILILIKLKPV